MIKTKELVQLEIGGFLFIFITGSLFHFLYDWSNHSLVVGLIAPVNESVWEHLKLALWPSLLYSIYEYNRIGRFIPNFWEARTLSTYIMPLTIIIIYYFYTAIIGYNILLIDILTFAIAVALGQLSSYLLLTSRQVYKPLNQLGPILLTALVVIFAYYTINPPHLPIFQDPQTGSFGIVLKL